MSLRPSVPSPPPGSIGDLQEVFAHPYFTAADEATQVAIMRASSQSKYDGENAYPWDHYFEVALQPWLSGKRVLDLGCFNGGRTVAWCERYGFAETSGIDVDRVYISCASAFASAKGCAATFRVGYGESMPFEDGTFDAIVTFDVLEHVRDVSKTLSECWRVLRPDGVLIAVFPSYFQPNEHHLGLATRLPGLQLLFPGSSLVAAYHQILDARGESARWYRRDSPQLASWERGHTLNGITFARFRRVMEEHPWTARAVSHKPIGAVGRNAAQVPGLRSLATAFRPLTYVPGVQEIFLHRIAVILQKPA